MTIWPALDTKFAVCLGRAHGESGSFAVCLPSGHTANLGALPIACRPGTRRIWERCRVPAVRAHGEQPPTPSAGRDGVCPLFFAVSLYIHTANKVFAVPMAAVRALLSATVGEIFAMWLRVFAVCLEHTVISGLRL